jgi:hypothetical protein
MKSCFPKPPKMARIGKATALSNRLKREPRILKQRSGKLESEALLILQWSKTGCGFECAHQITRTHMDKLRQAHQPDRLSEVRAEPILDLMDTRMQVVPE